MALALPQHELEVTSCVGDVLALTAVSRHPCTSYWGALGINDRAINVVIVYNDPKLDTLSIGNRDAAQDWHAVPNQSHH